MTEITADWLLARAEDDGAGCLVWTCYCEKGKPKAWLRGTARFVRRELWRAMHERDPLPSHGIEVSCGTRGCVEPAHLVERLTSHWNIGKPRPLDVRLRMSKTKRAKDTPLSEEAIADILSQSASQRELARRWNTSGRRVARLQGGRLYRRTVFTGLGARAC